MEFWTPEIPTRKTLKPTIYPREKFETREIPVRSTRPTMARDPRILLAHSIGSKVLSFVKNIRYSLFELLNCTLLKMEKEKVDREN